MQNKYSHPSTKWGKVSIPNNLSGNLQPCKICSTKYWGWSLQPNSRNNLVNTTTACTCGTWEVHCVPTHPCVCTEIPADTVLCRKQWGHFFWNTELLELQKCGKFALKSSRGVKIETENMRARNRRMTATCTVKQKQNSYIFKWHLTKCEARSSAINPEQMRFIDPYATNCSGVPLVWLKISEGINSL